jgi:hypothetical protein
MSGHGAEKMRLQILRAEQLTKNHPTLLDHHSAHTSTQDTDNFLSLILIINTPHDVSIVENIFINNYTLDECTYRCIIYSVTAHPEDGQARPKHVGGTN